MRCLLLVEAMGKFTSVWISFHFISNSLKCYIIMLNMEHAQTLSAHSCRQQDLFRILKAYTVYRPDEGYCQAQAPVAAVLLMHMPAEVRATCGNFSSHPHHPIM